MKNILNKKGFTLIELLAVIVILSVLMLIAVPSVLKIVNNSKKNAFKDQAQTILKQAQTQYASDERSGSATYSSAGTTLDLTKASDVVYTVTISEDGVTAITVCDDTYHITGADGTDSDAVISPSELTSSDVDQTLTDCPVS